MTDPSFVPHENETLRWEVLGGAPAASRKYVASIPPSLGASTITLATETLVECARARLELNVALRFQQSDGARVAAVASVLIRAEGLAISLVDRPRVDGDRLARSEAGLPSTRDSSLVATAVEALSAHVAAAGRALGLGALGAAHTAPSMASGHRRVAKYRTGQTWLGGSDLWPIGADYVPPRPERVAALMEDLVEFCAKTDVDAVAQAAIAHAQLLSIQPFPSDNGRAARALINGVLRRRGLTGALVVPISAAIAGDRWRYASAWRAYREGDANPMVLLVAHHALRAVKEATESADRVALLPQAWMGVARPRRGSTAHALIPLLGEHPIVTAAAVQGLIGASQASAYGAIAQLANAGVLRRISRTRRDTVWAAGDVIDEVDRVVARLSGHG